MHVERAPQTFPNVAGTMFVELEIPVEDLSNGLFGRNLKDRAVIVDHVDYSDPSSLLGELADDIFGILPPLDLAIRLNMQIFAPGAVVLSLSGLKIDLDSWLATVVIEPVGDVSACGFYERSGKRIGYMFLDESSEVVYFPEEDDPTIVGRVVVAHFLKCVISLLFALNWQKLLETVLGRATHEVI